MVRRSPSTRVLFAAALALAPLTSAPALAAGDGRELARGVGEDAPRVLGGDGGPRVVTPLSSTPLALPPAAAIEGVAAVGAGWVVTGTRAEGDGRELWLLAGGEGEAAHELPAPPSRTGRVRERPAAVVADGRLVGLAWLEGDTRRTYAVRWASWLGRTFAEPVEVAPRGPGSQLALGATRLDDGRTLLVWSGYDGVDDEIWASVGDGERWTRPERVGDANEVPDITPTAIAAPGGAWVAWSRFDGGEYRTALARYAGGRFGATRLVGDPGSIFPTFERGGESPLLLWHDARAEAWRLGELAANGTLTTRATAPGPESARPALVDRNGVVGLADTGAASPPR